MNPYEILGLNNSCSIEDIEKAYRDHAKKYHPDLNQDNPDAEKTFKKVQSAYELLKRIKTNGNDGGESFKFRSRSGFNDFDFGINEFFSKSLFKGRNIQIKVEISLSEVLSGCNKKVIVKRRIPCTICSGQGFSDFINCEDCSGEGFVQINQPPFVVKRGCSSCGGTGRINVKKCSFCSGLGYSSHEDKDVNIKIPPGIENGAQLVFSGEGEPSLKSGKHGDLIVIISVKSNPFFKREGPNINLEVPVSYTQLLFGADIVVPCITDERIILKVPAFCSPTARFKIRGKGLPYKGSIGDMIISLKLEVPKEINDEYKQCLESLASLEKKYITTGRDQWSKKFDQNKE